MTVSPYRPEPSPSVIAARRISCSTLVEVRDLSNGDSALLGGRAWSTLLRGICRGEFEPTGEADGKLRVEVQDTDLDCYEHFHTTKSAYDDFKRGVVAGRFDGLPTPLAGLAYGPWVTYMGVVKETAV